MDQPEFYVPEQKVFGELVKEVSVSDLDKQNIVNAVMISGFPYDEGTKLNNGRIGGAMASTIFRRYLKQRQIYLHHKIPMYDTGDIKPEQCLQQAHQQLYLKQKQILEKSVNKQNILFSIGGSNDQSYCNVKGLLQSYPDSKIGVINIDAHFDVRPLKDGKAHSGSPFRQMLQNQIFQKNNSKFVQFANKGSVCSSQHFKYLQSQGCQVYWLEKHIRTTKIPSVSKYKTQAGYLFNKIVNKLITEDKVQILFISFDVDSISSKFMPGVSAPSVIGGLDSSQALQIMNITGNCQKVKLVDCSQFNPSVESTISSIMLIEMFYALCNSFGMRIKNK